MITLVRAEWLELRTVVGNVVLLVLFVALPIGFSILIPLILRKDQLGDITRNDLFGLALAGLVTAQALVEVISVQLITPRVPVHPAPHLLS